MKEVVLIIGTILFFIITTFVILLGLDKEEVLEELFKDEDDE